MLVCKGFSQCAANGYSSFGYGPDNYRKMWWRMYAGHNCTNYVSYRMIQRGLPTTRPWSGSGDARNWGVVFASKVDQTPLIGSIAWWSSNHVAIVQRIIDENTIVISEDHYGGDFDWRKIQRSGGGWPTGFIHLADEQLTTTAAPRIRISPKVGVLTAGSRVCGGTPRRATPSSGTPTAWLSRARPGPSSPRPRTSTARSSR